VSFKIIMTTSMTRSFFTILGLIFMMFDNFEFEVLAFRFQLLFLVSWRIFLPILNWLGPSDSLIGWAN